MAPREKKPEDLTAYRSGIYERMYWTKVDQELGPCPIFEKVVSDYNPFAAKRMPGFDPEDQG
jgi:hypothetical protein